MTYALRNALAILPLSLILSGCAGPQRSESSFDREPRPSARARGHPVALVADRSDEPPDHAPAGSVQTNKQHDITLEQIREHMQNKTAVVIDARSPEHFASGHVRGAINVPAGQMKTSAAQIQQTVATRELIIIYCANPACGAGDMVYEYLAAQGFTNMRVYRPGWMMLATAKDMH